MHGRAHASRVAECSRCRRDCANQWCFQHTEVVELVAELFTQGRDASTLQDVAQFSRSPKHAHMVRESAQARYTHDQQSPQQDMGVPGSRHCGFRIVRTVAIPQKRASPLAEGVCVDVLAACSGAVSLVSGLTEAEANEVLGLLLNADISATKTTSKAGAGIQVEAGSMSTAIEILHRNGLPRERRSKLGDVFKKENLISSPLEERARYLYALSQELEQTLTNPTHLAVALLYEHGETPLPVVLAKGAGLQAQAIMREARAEGIPIIQHIPLARALVAQVEVDEPVPEHLFELVIDVLKAVKEIAPAERSRS